MKNKIEYKPLWHGEWVRYDCYGDVEEIIDSKLLTKGMPSSFNSDNGKWFHCSLVNTKKRQRALGMDLYDTDDLEEIYEKAYLETLYILRRLVYKWFEEFNRRRLNKFLNSRHV